MKQLASQLCEGSKLTNGEKGASQLWEGSIARSPIKKGGLYFWGLRNGGVFRKFEI